MVEATRQDEQAVEARAQLELEVRGHRRRAHGRVVNQVQVDQAQRRQRLGQRQVLRLHLRKLTRAVEHTVRREPDADTIAADGRDRGARNLQRQPVAGVDAAAVAIGPHIDQRVQELLDQVAVGAMELDTVEPGVQRQLRGGHVLLHGLRDVGFGHGAWRAVGLHAQRIGEHLAGARGRARPQHLGTGRQVGRVRHAAAVHELHEDLAAVLATVRVHGSRRRFPAIHLCRVVQPRNARVAQAVGAWRGALGDDQSCARALAVVRGHQGIWRVLGRGPAARHRRHHHAIGQMQRAGRERVEEHRINSWKGSAQTAGQAARRPQDQSGPENTACVLLFTGSVRWRTPGPKSPTVRAVIRPRGSPLPGE